MQAQAKKGKSSRVIDGDPITMVLGNENVKVCVYVCVCVCVCAYCDFSLNLLFFFFITKVIERLSGEELITEFVANITFTSVVSTDKNGDTFAFISNNEQLVRVTLYFSHSICFFFFALKNLYIFFLEPQRAASIATFSTLLQMKRRTLPSLSQTSSRSTPKQRSTFWKNMQSGVNEWVRGSEWEGVSEWVSEWVSVCAWKKERKKERDKHPSDSVTLTHHPNRQLGTDPFAVTDPAREPVHGELFRKQIHRRELKSIRTIGSGQFGEVFLATQQTQVWGKDVVVCLKNTKPRRKDKTNKKDNNNNKNKQTKQTTPRETINVDF